MGSLRVVGSFKLYVSFEKDPYKRDYSAKETCILKESTNDSHLMYGSLALSSDQLVGSLKL